MAEHENMMFNPSTSGNGPPDDGDLNDMLEEVRILLPAAQLLTSFLIILPFSSGFDKIQHAEKWIFLVTFVCSISSLILFSAPAAQHRLMRPLKNRSRFKVFATREILLGLIMLFMALVLGTHLVISEVFRNRWLSHGLSVLVTLLMGIFWWALPHYWKQKKDL